LSITSSWGNGHATTYRALVKGLARRGHRILFLERDVPWYAAHRDLPQSRFATTRLYRDLDELRTGFTGTIEAADLVVLGSYVPDGVAVARWMLQVATGVRAFYDIDTPVTLGKLCRDDHEYIAPDLVPRFDLYLSFAGGRALSALAHQFGARRPRPLYCSVDPDVHHACAEPWRWDLGYMGTYSPDRQPGLEALLLAPARALPERAFAVAGPQYPNLAWPANVRHFEHLPPAAHASFYSAQRFTLNLTRADMVGLGCAPSVRLFEAAAIGTPIISDPWPGLETFFAADKEILIARSGGQVVSYLRDLDETSRQAIAAAAKRRVLAFHTLDQRALELERYVAEVRRELDTTVEPKATKQVA
jgi:spore maturation protein CgeB